MFKLAIEVCFESHFGLIHAIFLSLGSTKSGYFFLGHPVFVSKNFQGWIQPENEQGAACREGAQITIEGKRAEGAQKLLGS